MKAIYPEDQ